ncbi:hypothetical protein [Azospirillum doebereinerae]|uniref:Uncharacterized protein n=1 Tax=Azospirillum doebereinerae TaxID=92933 RepID=A0A3S0VDX9_9PROT|nr:hypothetical protein [Azospirillum doebereinerae]RUQ61978.1 hypothetical protein EJ913_29285 [Azospirillum doebereinerae]
MREIDWRECHAVRFDRPGDVRRFQLRRDQWMVLLAVGEVPQASPLAGPGVYGVNVPATLHRGPFPILAVAMPAMVAVLLARRGEKVRDLPVIPLADPATGAPS